MSLRPYSASHKASGKARRRRQYAFVRRGDATPHEALGEARYLPLSLAILWLWSGLQPVLTAPQESLQLLAQIGVPPALQQPLFYAASAWNVVLGMCCFTPFARGRALWGLQAATVAAYTLIVAWCLPQAWLHPFAPLIKNLPILALICYLARRNP